MNCMDCAANDQATPAVGVCHDCGAGVCIDHAVSRDRHLTRIMTINRKVKVEPPARVLRCEVLPGRRRPRGEPPQASSPFGQSRALR